MANILIVEDDQLINELVYKNLTLVGYNCISVFDGEAVFEQLEENPIDLILLDIMLPKMDGFQIIKQIKEIPIIFLTSQTSLAGRIKGFTLGADDYITKPFEMLELIARVEAVLRRTKKEMNRLEFLNIYIDMKSRQVFMDNQLVDCTLKEYELLEVLIKNRNIALSREKLLELVWGYDYEGETRTVDVHIQRLRKKLCLEDYIKTVYKYGYRLEVKS